MILALRWIKMTTNQQTYPDITEVPKGHTTISTSFELAKDAKGFSVEVLEICRLAPMSKIALQGLDKASD